VETDAQLDLLKHYGCDEAQGYLLARPMAASRISEMAPRANRPARAGAYVQTVGVEA
jgi:EAL domain-containing protein (putative c-di-GMP-specific phosphodiesterase class I)